MAVKQEPITFQGWLEDFIKTPVEIPRETIAVVKKLGTDTFVAMAYRRFSANTSLSNADVLAAYSEGPESVSDIKGINTAVNLADLVKHPKLAIMLLGKNTIKQILDMDEISQDRREAVVGRLVRGQVTDGSIDEDADVGKSLENPDNRILKLANAKNVFPISGAFPIEDDPRNPRRKRSKIAIVKKVIDANGKIKWVDAKKVDEEELAKGKYIRPLSALARSLSSMASNYESTTGRIKSRQAVITEYSRAIAEDLFDLDLDAVLDTSRQISISTAAKLEAEAAKKLGRKTMPKRIDGNIDTPGTLHVALVNDSRDINDLVNDNDWMRKALKQEVGFNLATLPQHQRVFLQKFVRDEVLNIKASYYDARIHTPEDLLLQWRQAGLSPHLDLKTKKPRDYVGSTYQRGLLPGDMEQLGSRNALDSYAFIERNRAHILADIQEATEKRYRKAYANKIITNTQLNGKPLDEYIQDKKSLARERFRNSLEATRVANDLFFAGTAKEFLEGIEQGSLAKLLVVNTRLLGLVPFSNTPRSLEAVDFIADKTRLSKYYTSRKSIQADIKEAKKALKISGISASNAAAQTAKITQLQQDLKMYPLIFAPLGIAMNTMTTLTKKIFNNTGISFHAINGVNEIPNGFLKLINKTGIFNSKSFINVPFTRGSIKGSKLIKVKSKDVQGLFASDIQLTNLTGVKGGVLASSVQKNKIGLLQFFGEVEDSEGLMAHLENTGRTPAKLIESAINTPTGAVSDLDKFFDQFQKAAQGLVNGQTLTGDLAHFESFLFEKNFLQEVVSQNGTRKIVYSKTAFEVAKTNLFGKTTKYKKEIPFIDLVVRSKNSFKRHGLKFFKKLSDPSKMGDATINPENMWDYVKKLSGSKHFEALSTSFAGLLDHWNRLANSGRDWLYKNVVWGNSLGNMPVIGSLLSPITNRLQSTLGSLGFSDEIGLTRWVNRSNLIRRMRIIGKGLDGVVKNPSGFRTRYIAKFLGKFGSSLVSRLASNALTHGFIKLLSTLLINAGGLASGGIAWAIASIGQIAWAFSKNLLTLNVGKGVKEATEVIKTKLAVIKKIVLYPIAGCCLGVIGIPIVVVMLIIPSVIAPLGSGGGSYADTTTKLIAVTKDAKVVGDNIRYTISIVNKSVDPVTITSFTDTLSYTPSCNSSGLGSTSFYKDANFVGDVSNFPEGLEGTEIAGSDGIAGGSDEKIITFTVSGIPTTNNSTYYNVVNVKIAEEPGKTGTADAVTTLGSGGCITCPSGWPIDTPFSVTQGPYRHGGGTSHADEHAEAVDLSDQDILDRPIKATHGGVASIGYDGDGYGNYVFVTSSNAKKQSYITIYAHMSAIESGLKTGSKIVPGMTIGYVGSTGNSTGAHLHYEFNKPLYECIPGENLRLDNVMAPGYPESYVPTTIEPDCADNAPEHRACNQRIN